jgi:ribulose-5-phosphate 4-epimerase/fuculose-1-phosphate aldolase
MEHTISGYLKETYNGSNMNEQSIPDSDLGSRDNAQDLLSFGKSFGLLDETSDGSISSRVYGTESIWISPSGIAKSLLNKEDFVYVTPHVCSGSTNYIGDKEPEDNTLVHARLYDMFPKLSGIIHFRSEYVVPTVTVDSYDSSGFQILDAMEYKINKSAMVEIGNNEYLALLIQGASELWISMAETIDAAKRLVDLTDTDISPVFIGAKIGGLVIKTEEEYRLFLNIEYENSFEESLILRQLPEDTVVLRG